jgi:hypothetical protein
MYNMKRRIMIILLILTLLSLYYVSASEVSFLGTAPITKVSETGLAIDAISNSTSSFVFDSNELYIEIFYRKCNVEGFDWGFTLAPMKISDFPGSPNFLYDIKSRILKGSGAIPTITIGVNILRIVGIPDNLQAIFVDQGRIGLSWETHDYSGREGQIVKRNVFFIGATVQSGTSTLGNRFYAGAKFDRMGFTVIFENGLNTVGLSYSF